MKGKNATYKRLGDYIREVDVRNSQLQCTNLLGLSIAKIFIPSIANIVGTDFRPYKIVKHNQFAYVPVTSRNGDKITVALYEGHEDCIISQAYTSFEIKDTDILLPEYLMMWFRRPEFDRYARFKSHGSAREVFDWSEMCDVMMPIPNIAEQQRIVKQYNTIKNRIETNKQTIAKLEEAAQALYRKMFIDNIDPHNLPEGWRMGKIEELFELQRGFDLPSQNRISGQYPIYASTGIAEYHNEFKVEAPGIITGRSGSIGEVFYIDENLWPLNTTLWVKDFKKSSPFYVYFKLKELELNKLVIGFAAVPTLNRNDVHMIESTIPNPNTMELFQRQIEPLHKHKINLLKEQIKLTELQSLLLAKMGR